MELRESREGCTSLYYPEKVFGLPWNPSVVFGYTQNQKSLGFILFDVSKRVGWFGFWFNHFEIRVGFDIQLSLRIKNQNSPSLE